MVDADEKEQETNQAEEERNPDKDPDVWLLIADLASSRLDTLSRLDRNSELQVVRDALQYSQEYRRALAQDFHGKLNGALSSNRLTFDSLEVFFQTRIYTFGVALYIIPAVG